MVTKKLNSRMFSVLFIVAMLVGVVAFPYPARAASITVTKIADTNDGVCDSDCSLREAIAVASTGDTITFDAALAGQTIILQSTLGLEKGIVIDGSGLSSHIKINGNNAFSAFSIPKNLFGIPITIKGLDIEDCGNSSIYQWSSTLAITDVNFSNNHSSDYGGAIFIDNGILIITDSSFIGNHANSYGGAIVNKGEMTITRSVFENNSTNVIGGAIYNNNQMIVIDSTFINNSRGAIYSYNGFTNASVSILRSTFTQNSPYGIYNDGNGILNVTNSTFSSNNGVGIFNLGAHLTVDNSTFTNNTGNGTSGGIHSDSNGLLPSSLSITNSILANTISGPDCYIVNTTLTNVNNLIETNGSGVNACGTPLLVGDPNLGTLGNNGGLTQTHPLLLNSPAIDAGDDAYCPATDQRGATRPQGSHCDIGAYESPASGDFAWAKGIGGTGDDRGSGVVTDSNGNIYSTGNFSATVDFDPGLGISNLTSNGSGDIFISKFDTNGSMVWAKNMGGSGFDFGADIAIDSNANIYIIGSYTGTVDFDPGTGQFNLSSVSSSGDIFLAKFDTNGNFVWAKSMGGAQFDQGLNITLDANNNIYAMGDFSGTADFDPEAGVSNLVSAGWFDIFITKFDSFGNFVWAKGVGGTGEDYASGISTDSVGNIYATGSFSATADFDPNVGVLNLVSNGTVDLFIAKLTSSGELSWAKKMGGTGDDEGFDIIVDSDNNVYTTGIFSDTIDIDPGINEAFISSAGFTDIFVAKLDGNGNFMWADNMGGTGDDFGVGISRDSNNNIYVTGHYRNTVDFNPTVGIFNMTSAGFFDVFVISLAGNGDFLWAKGMGGTGGDYGYSITLDGGNNIYTTGSFSGTAEFDPGIGVFNLNSAGLGDIFISKLYNDVNPIVSSIIRANPSPTVAASVNFTVNFSESVTGVDAGEFTLTTTGSVSGAAVSGLSGSGSVYTVTVNTGSGNGTIRLDVVDNNSIVDAASNPLGGAAVGDGNFTTGEVYTINKPFAPASLWTTSFDLSHGWTVSDFVRTVGDVNNDGRDDLIGFGLDGVYVALSTGTGFGPISRWTTAFDLSHGWTVKDFVRTVGDVNNDGRDDLIGFGLDGVYVALSNGTSFGAISRWTTSFDLSHGWTVKDFVRTVGDVNNDGRDDLIGFGLDGVYVALSNGTSFGAISRWTTAFDLSHGWTVKDFVRTVGDVNNDGRDDLIGFGLDGVYVALSNGTSFGAISRWTTSFDLSHGWTVADFVRTVGDVNLDGRDDLLGFGVDGVYVALSNGASFDSVSRWTNDFDLSHGWTVSQFVRTVGDVNVDGKADLVGFGLDGVYIGTAK